VSLSVTLIAEGAGEDRGARPNHLPQPDPGEALVDEELGAGHLLFRRAIAHARSLPEDAVRFHAPLRLRSGRLARGSDLLVSNRVKQLLTYPPGPAPDLALVLVDADGEPSRFDEVSRVARRSTRPAAVIAIAVQEFEAWLVADPSACATLGMDDPPTAPELLQPGHAKQWLARQTAREHQSTRRRDLARTLNLDTLASRCPAFETLVRALIE